MTALTQDHRERLRGLRERKATARERVAAARKALDAASQMGDGDAVAAANAAMASAQGEVAVAMELENIVLGQLSGTSGSLGVESFLEDPSTVRMLEQFAGSSLPIDRIALGPASTREALMDTIRSEAWAAPRVSSGPINYSGDTGRTAAFYGTVVEPRRPLSVLSLIPQSPMEGTVVPFIRESGDYDTNVAETAESAVKPADDVTLSESEARAQTIANYIKAPRQVLADVPGLEQTIHERLIYKVLRRLEAQALAGDGIGVNLFGIVRNDGIAVEPYEVGLPLADAVLSGIRDVILSGVDPDAIVLNPVDWANQMTQKASGSGEYISVDGPFGQVPGNLWGLPLVVSGAMPQGQALVGSFGRGARIFIRDPVNVLVGMDQDDMVRNRVTLLGEMRAAVAVLQPSAFALVHLVPPS